MMRFFSLSKLFCRTTDGAIEPSKTTPKVADQVKPDYSKLMPAYGPESPLYCGYHQEQEKQTIEDDTSDIPSISSLTDHPEAYYSFAASIKAFSESPVDESFCSDEGSVNSPG
ncbi:MAG: hypothetical protein ACOYKA_07220 [Legionellaceae bacterium]